jgi:hypothetical protein
MDDERGALFGAPLHVSPPLQKKKRWSHAEEAEEAEELLAFPLLSLRENFIE